MKFSCEKALLQSAVTTASRTVAVKSSIPALEGLLVEAGDALRLTGYNLETGIRTVIPAQVTQPGMLVLSARLFGDIVRKLPDDIVHFSTDQHMVNIKCGMSEFNILGSDPEEFPELPVVDNLNSFTIGQDTLRCMIDQTLFAVSDNESRPVHTGSLFEVDEKTLTIVAVDGYRLALRRENIGERRGADVFSFVVPGSTLSEAEKICVGGDAPITVVQGERHVMFDTGDTILVSRRLEGEFLVWRKAIPKNSPIVLEGDTRSMMASIERVALIISDRLKSPLRCTFGDGELSITTKTGVGDASDRCPITGNGGGLEIGFNNKYLMDALKAAPADRVKLELGTSIAPCLIRPCEGEETFLYMVLPVRLR